MPRRTPDRRLRSAGRRRLLRTLAAVLALAGCDGTASQSAAPPPGHAGPLGACDALKLEGAPRERPVVLLLADTLRRDRLGAYGGPARTPRFDGFAEEHHLFTRVTSQSPWTKPSMATLFTGQYPSTHGVLSHPVLRPGSDGEDVLVSDVLVEGAVTLAEDLAGAGYRTAAFVSNPWMKSELGFSQGFETYDDSLAGNDTPGTAVSEAGLAWLRDRPRDGRPWFLYLHSMDAHAPYAPVGRERLLEELAEIRRDDRAVPVRVSREIARLARDGRGRPWVRAGAPPNLALMELVYDQGVERFDRALGVLLDGLDGIPGAEEAAILVVSDHGEALFHRGWRGHGLGMYQDETAVPFAARLPGVRGSGPVDCPLGLVDLRATLCDYLGIDCAGPDEGVSAFRGEGGHYLIVEGVKGKPGNRAILNGRYKLIQRRDGPVREALPVAARTESLFDVVRDPEERQDLLAGGEVPAAAREVADRLRSELRRLPTPSAAGSAPRIELDTATRERLEALGYVGGDAEPDPGDD